MATEKRLIRADETVYAFTKWLTSTYDGRMPVDIVNEIPTVDAVEVVHGRWFWSEKNECWFCSYCEMSALNNYRGNSTDSNYCPNCGADMRERKDND